MGWYAASDSSIKNVWQHITILKCLWFLAPSIIVVKRIKIANVDIKKKHFYSRIAEREEAWCQSNIELVNSHGSMTEEAERELEEFKKRNFFVVHKWHQQFGFSNVDRTWVLNEAQFPNFERFSFISLISSIQFLLNKRVDVIITDFFRLFFFFYRSLTAQSILYLRVTTNS